MQARTITLADGTIIDTSTGRIADLPVPSVATNTIDAPMLTAKEEQIGKERRPNGNTLRLSDLGTSPRMLVPVSAVLSLTMIGVLDAEICTTLGITPQQLLRLRGLDLYDDCRSRMLSKIRQADQDQVRQSLYDAAADAAKALTKIVATGNDKLKLAAANSILDRTGHKAADIVQHKHDIDGELRVRIIDDAADRDIPVIDVQPNDIISN